MFLSSAKKIGVWHNDRWDTENQSNNERSASWCISSLAHRTKCIKYCGTRKMTSSFETIWSFCIMALPERAILNYSYWISIIFFDPKKVLFWEKLISKHTHTICSVVEVEINESNGHPWTKTERGKKITNTLLSVRQLSSANMSLRSDNLCWKPELIQLSTTREKKVHAFGVFCFFVCCWPNVCVLFFPLSLSVFIRWTAKAYFDGTKQKNHWCCRVCGFVAHYTMLTLHHRIWNLIKSRMCVFWMRVPFACG